jgi:zinc transporter ZupT
LEGLGVQGWLDVVLAVMAWLSGHIVQVVATWVLAVAAGVVVALTLLHVLVHLTRRR